MRPKIKITLTLFDKLVESMSWLLLIILWIIILWCFFKLPETIPLHYNFSGIADSYGNKYTYFILPVVGTLLFVLLTIINRYPHLFNYPVKITEDNALKLYTIATRLIRYMKMVILLIFLFIEITTYKVSTHASPGLVKWFLPLTFALIFIPLIYVILKSVLKKK